METTFTSLYSEAQTVLEPHQVLGVSIQLDSEAERPLGNGDIKIQVPWSYQL